MRRTARGSPSRNRVILRECSVVIVGSRCGVCDKDFKCQSDVALHAQWRHNVAAIGSADTTATTTMTKEGGGYLEFVNEECGRRIADLWNLVMYNRRQQAYKQRERARPRLVIKIGGVVMMNRRFSRKHLTDMRSDSNPSCHVHIGTQTDPGECKGPRNYLGVNIDLSGRLVGDDGRVRTAELCKAANRYTVGKFAKSDATTTTATQCVQTERSLIEISNTSKRNTTHGNDHHPVLCNDHHANYEQTSPQAKLAEIVSISDAADVHNKENSQNVNCTADETTMTTTTSSSLTRNKTVTGQKAFWHRGRSNDTFAQKVNFARQSDRTTEKAISPHHHHHHHPIETMEMMMVDRENNVTSARRYASRYEPIECVDDDVQEVLRISRGNVRIGDINHESPSRSERETLIQNALRVMYLPTAHDVYPSDKDHRTPSTNGDSSSDSSFVEVAVDYDKPRRNVDALLHARFDNKLNCYLEELQEYGIRYCDDFAEMNDNNNDDDDDYSHGRLHEYVIRAQDDFLNDNPAPVCGNREKEERERDEKSEDGENCDNFNSRGIMGDVPMG